MGFWWNGGKWSTDLLYFKILLHPLEPVLSRKRNSMLHEKLIFHWDNTVIVSGFIVDDFFENISRDGPISLCIKGFELIEIVRFHHFGISRDIDFNCLITSEISCCSDLFFREWAVDQVCCSIIEVVWTHRCREELSEWSVLLHLSEYFVYFLFSLLFCVLLIEDTVGFISQSDTTETKRAVDDIEWMIDMWTHWRIDRTIDIIRKLSCTTDAIEVITFRPCIETIVKTMTAVSSVDIEVVSPCLESIRIIGIFDIITMDDTVGVGGCRVDVFGCMIDVAIILIIFFPIME